MRRLNLIVLTGVLVGVIGCDDGQKAFLEDQVKALQVQVRDSKKKVAEVEQELEKQKEVIAGKDKEIGDLQKAKEELEKKLGLVTEAGERVEQFDLNLENGFWDGLSGVQLPKLKLMDGTEYEEVKISRATAKAIHFSHASGLGSAEYEKMAEEHRHAFGYDARYGAYFRQQERLGEEARKKAEASAVANGSNEAPAKAINGYAMVNGSSGGSTVRNERAELRAQQLEKKRNKEELMKEAKLLQFDIQDAREELAQKLNVAMTKLGARKESENPETGEITVYYEKLGKQYYEYYFNGRSWSPGFPETSPLMNFIGMSSGDLKDLASEIRLMQEDLKQVQRELIMQ